MSNQFPVAEVIETLNAIESTGTFSFVAVTEQEALKKSRKTKEPTPARLQTVKVYRACTVSLGNNYQQAVNNRREKEGKEADFQAQGTYCAPIADNLLVYKHNTQDKHYLRVYPNLAHSFKNVVKRFDANGVEISAEEWAALQEEYFKMPSKNESQGLDKAIIVNNYSLENVRFLKRGEIHLDTLTADIIKKLAA